jgi:hypothetical protein
MGPRFAARLGAGAKITFSGAARLSGREARLPGAEVELVDIDPTREPIATGLGCRFAVSAPKHTEADLVIHASGRPAFNSFAHVGTVILAQ